MQVIGNTAVGAAPGHYYGILPDIMAPLGNAVGEGAGYVIRHALFGNNPGEELQLSQARHTDEATQEAARGQFQQWDVEHPGAAPADRLAAAHQYGVKADTGTDANLYSPLTTQMRGQASIAGAQDIQQAAGLPPTTPQQSPPPGVAVLFQQDHATPEQQGNAVATPGGGVAATPQYQEALKTQQAVTQAGQTNMQAAPNPQQAGDKIGAAQQQLAQGAVPQLTPAQKVQGQALIQRIGAYTSSMAAIGKGEYSPQTALQMAGIYNSTSQSVDQLAKIAASALGTSPTLPTMKQVQDYNAWQAWNNPATRQAIIQKGLGPAYEAGATRFDAWQGQANQIDNTVLAGMVKGIPMNPDTLHSFLAADMVTTQIANQKLEGQALQQNMRQSNGNFQWQTSLHGLMRQDMEVKLQAEKLGLQNATVFDAQKIQLDITAKQQEMQRAQLMIGPELDQKAANLAATKLQMNEMELNNTLKVEEFVGSKEAQQAAVSRAALEKTFVDAQTGLEKVGASPAALLNPNDPTVKAQTKNYQDIIAATKPLLLEQLKPKPQQLNSQGYPVSTPSETMRGDLLRFRGHMDEYMGSLYKSEQKNPSPQSPWGDPNFYAGRTTLMSHDKNNQLPTSNLPQDNAVRAISVLAAQNTLPGHELTLEQFKSLPVNGKVMWDPQDKTKDKSLMGNDPNELAKAWQLYNEWLKTKRAQGL
jgi:hypothetical protein